MIRIYCLDISEISEEQYQTYYMAASKARQEKAQRCRFLEDKIRCVMSDLLLRYAAAEFTGSSVQTEEVILGPQGKPCLKNADGFFYNLSHSGDWAVLACGDHEVGIDVEKLRENAKLELLTRRFFTEEERKYIFAPEEEGEQRIRFTKLWTCKESYVKYLGIGLAKGLETFSVNGEEGTITEKSGETTEPLMVKSWQLAEEYMMSLCCRQDEVELVNVSVQELYNSVN